MQAGFQPSHKVMRADDIEDTVALIRREVSVQVPSHSSNPMLGTIINDTICHKFKLNFQTLPDGIIPT